jgi:epoxyqueuosine reductase
VDTGPLMDKALAVQAGVGFYGKNTNVLTERYGSFVFLGEIVTTLHLTPDRPLSQSCGACRLCVMACPTGALGPEYTIDARLCISYLTIEHRQAIPRELRAKMGNWVYGCDICQEVCPPTVLPHFQNEDERRGWARSLRDIVQGASSGMEEVVPHELHASVRPAAHETLDLQWLLALDHATYLSAFRGTAIRRAKVWMLRRNAAVALGNVGSAADIPFLVDAMLGDEHPIVRGHSAWGLGRIAQRLRLRSVDGMLQAALDSEMDDGVRDEVIFAASMATADQPSSE